MSNEKRNKDRERRIKERLNGRKYCLAQCDRQIVEIDGVRKMYCSGCDRVL